MQQNNPLTHRPCGVLVLDWPKKPKEPGDKQGRCALMRTVRLLGSAVICLLIKTGRDGELVGLLAPASGLPSAQELLRNWPLLTKYQDPFLAHARAECPFLFLAGPP